VLLSSSGTECHRRKHRCEKTVSSATTARWYGFGYFRKRLSRKTLTRARKETKKEPASATFVVRSANGSRTNHIAGTAPTAITQKIFTTVAAPPGTLSPRTVVAPVAGTIGVGRFACAASAGRGMRTGITINRLRLRPRLANFARVEPRSDARP
jgi:hypothetical protein